MRWYKVVYGTVMSFFPAIPCFLVPVMFCLCCFGPPTCLFSESLICRASTHLLVRCLQLYRRCLLIGSSFPFLSPAFFSQYNGISSLVKSVFSIYTFLFLPEHVRSYIQEEIYKYHILVRSLFFLELVIALLFFCSSNRLSFFFYFA